MNMQKLRALLFASRLTCVIRADMVSISYDTPRRLIKQCIAEKCQCVEWNGAKMRCDVSGGARRARV